MPHSKAKHISLYDKSFQETDLREYILSLEIGIHYILICLYHSGKRKVVGLEQVFYNEMQETGQLSGQLDYILKKNPWLTVSFRYFNLIYNNEISTLVPLPLFDEKEKASYLRFNQPGQANHSTEYDILKNMQMANVYAMPISLINKTVEVWPEVKFWHFSSVLIESLAINYKNKSDNKTLFVNLRENIFDVVHFKEGKLNFYNAFRFRSKEDFIYFLLAVIEQLKLNPEEANIILSGYIEKGDPNYEMLYRYIRHFEFIERNETFQYSYVMDSLNLAAYYVPFNVIQCE